jgi:hypothetical protein
LLYDLGCSFIGRLLWLVADTVVRPVIILLPVFTIQIAIYGKVSNAYAAIKVRSQGSMFAQYLSIIQAVTQQQAGIAYVCLKVEPSG